MPNLRLNTDQGQDTVAILRSVALELHTNLAQGWSSADNLVGSAWEAPAAHEFHASIVNWRQMMEQALADLDMISRQLALELQEWEESAAVFGDGEAVGFGRNPFTILPGSPISGEEYSDSESQTGSEISDRDNVRAGNRTDPSQVNLPRETIAAWWERSRHYSSEDGWTTDNSPAELEDYFEAGVYVSAEAVIEEHQYENIYGPLSVAALGYTVGSMAQFGLNQEGLQGRVQSGVEVYALKADFDATVAGVDIAAEAQLGAGITSEAILEFNPLEGEVELEGEISAFAGVTAEAEISKDLGAAEAALNGEIGVGVGFSASGEIEFEDGAFELEFDIGAYAGIGGGFGVDIEVDIPEAMEAAVDIGEAAANIGGDVVGWLNPFDN